MNRAFVSLYLIIVLSIILLGLALNKFWDAISLSSDIDPATQSLISVAEKSLLDKNNDQKISQLKFLSDNSNYQFELANVNDFSSNNSLTEIKNGKIVSAGTEDNLYYYKRINNTNDVLIIIHKIESYQKTPIYIGFIIVFYGAIAAVIFLWVWPLSRDLARLSQHTQTLGKEGIPQIISISSRSVLFPFATAFNSMNHRLSDLINSQKEMTYAVSHELRTPLARMKFALAMAEEFQPANELQKQLTSIHQDIIDMELLINSLLVYAQFDQQTNTLQQKEGYIQDLVTDIIQRTITYSHSNLNVEVIDESQGKVFKCEWSLMQTAVQNLLENAFGYARTTIIVRLNSCAQTYLIQVEDDGPGVPIEQRERIFESFVRLYDENINRSGFGLGLALVKRIMGWHEGSVVCKKGVMGGALFELEWKKST